MGIYFHIPFCRQACYYCDFHFSTNLKLKDKLFSYMLKELSLQNKFLTGPVKSVYFGGGTPSLLSPQQIREALDLCSNFFVLKNPEITLECNPDDLNPYYLEQIIETGINRLSIGVQSLLDEELTFMNRVHTAREAHNALKNARSAGFVNLNIDLIYGIPGGSAGKVKQNIEGILLYTPEHISTYSLTIEPRTVFGNWQRKGKLKEEADEEVATQYEFLSEFLTDSGYSHYEISNFARPGFESVHNSNYWKGTPYLGIGPAAHSYDGDHRHFTIRNNAKYMEALEKGVLPLEREDLSREDKINEYLMTSLRTIWGCNLDVLLERFGYDLMIDHEKYITELVRTGKAKYENNTIQLTLQGRLLADKITSYLFL